MARVTIVGGGYGGITVAKALDDIARERKLTPDPPCTWMASYVLRLANSVDMPLPIGVKASASLA